MQAWLKNQENLLTLILVLFYFVGIVGIGLNPTEFVFLTPFNLALTAFLLFKLHPEKDLLFYINLLFVFVGAWFLEMIGVTTGSIFGNYTYGEALGFKLNQTPIIIGLNWIIVAYSSLQLVQTISIKLKVKLPEIAGALSAAFFMVVLDILIEPLAPKLNFWTWQNSDIPLQNYTAWFFFGFAFCYWMLKGGMLKNNPMGWRVYLAQIVFFAVLTLIF
ncbi:MAG: carotene biosynthesis protein [Bacteroidetes bacterium B1(2017)]|nr:MAG: carotene biosynthesis protein [Bacteroidetes bacterium B1(2017)]